MHIEEIKGTEAYLNASDIYYALIVGIFIIIIKCKIYVFVGYSLRPIFCVFGYSLILIYTGLFIWDDDRRISVMSVNLLWPWLHEAIHTSLFLSIFLTEQQNKPVNSG